MINNGEQAYDYVTSAANPRVFSQSQVVPKLCRVERVLQYKGTGTLV